MCSDEFQISSTNEAYDVAVPDGSVMDNFPDWLHDGDRQSIFIDQDGRCVSALLLLFGYVKQSHID